MTHRFSLSLLLAATLVFSGCASVVYDTMEQFGVAKRDLLVKRVLKARDAQSETKEQFQSALEEFSTLVNYKGGDLEKTYKKLNSEFEKSKAKAKAVKDRNDDVNSVAKVLFREWEQELKQYSDGSLKAASANQLAQTKARYNSLIGAMRRAEGTVDPVLRTFGDNVLFLKHNLNAQVIGSLKSELNAVEVNTTSLIREMNASIAEADQFIRSMGTSSGS